MSVKYHFHPAKGWLNDPNGLVWFKGKYHAFFQYNPHAAEPSELMHWGHAVSDDLIHWEEMPIAISPEHEYDGRGCWSGTAIVKDDLLYVFYTGIGVKDGRQRQAVAISDDGIHFKKHEGNPIVSEPPEDTPDFRDPAVLKTGDIYYMVVASGKDGVGKGYLYSSQDLFKWDYVGVFIENAGFGPIIECPSFTSYGNGYLFMCSGAEDENGFGTTRFMYGDFDGKTFTPEIESRPEKGPYLYAPQFFRAPDGRVIFIGWFSRWDKPRDPNAQWNGCLTIPREITVKDGKIYSFPVKEARHLLIDKHPLVHVTKDCVRMDTHWPYPVEFHGDVKDVKIIHDDMLLEVFINSGEAVYSLHLK